MGVGGEVVASNSRGRKGLEAARPAGKLWVTWLKPETREDPGAGSCLMARCTAYKERGQRPDHGKWNGLVTGQGAGGVVKVEWFLVWLRVYLVLSGVRGKYDRETQCLRLYICPPQFDRKKAAQNKLFVEIIILTSRSPPPKNKRPPLSGTFCNTAIWRSVS